VTAPYLLTAFDAAYLLALTAWVGSILFFSFGVAPIIFRVLDPEAGSKFVRALFPRYYAWGAICAAIALPAYVAGPLTHPEFRGPAVAVQSLLIIAGALIMLYCGNSLTPQINAARDAGPPQSARFDQLHRRSVRLNSLVLLAGIGLLVAHAARRSATTGGIVELAPAQRAAYDKAFANTLIEEVSSEHANAAPTFPADSPERREIRDLLAEQRRRNASKIARIKAEAASRPAPAAAP